MSQPDKTSTVLRARHLRLDVLTENAIHQLVHDITFEVNRGEVLGIVGESGSGKTVTCMSLTRLLPQPPFIYHSGEVLFEDQNIWSLPESKLRKIRGTGIGVIFQEAMSALNPVLTVGDQVAEIFRIHRGMDRKSSLDQTVQLFVQVGIPSPEVRLRHYPHQLSGGLQQRVMIAMALAGNPHLLIADEPTTALDVTIQVQILELLKGLQKQGKMAIIFISHDLGLIAEMCDRVLVMYAGEIVEQSPVQELFSRATHPYTRLLIQTIPHLGKKRGKLQEIPGQVPFPANFPDGCRFHPRCPQAREKCRGESPGITHQNDKHSYRCWYPEHS